MTELAMSSKVMDKKLIQTPEGNVVDSDEEWDGCGKWMLHHPQADLEFLDSAWTVLQNLLPDGTLIMLKATTGLVADAGTSIYCFTRPGKQEAKRAATAVSRLVNFNGIMYYKLNKQTDKEIANRCGDKGASIYMQTLRGRFYIKKNDAWIQDIEDGAENVPIASRFSKENYSGNYKLPSNCKEHCFWSLPDKSERTELSNWYLFCSCEDEDGYLTGVDRVWFVAKQLFDEGLFVGISLIKLKNAEYAEVRLYVSQDCDLYSRHATESSKRPRAELSCISRKPGKESPITKKEPLCLLMTSNTHQVENSTD